MGNALVSECLGTCDWHFLVFECGRSVDCGDVPVLSFSSHSTQTHTHTHTPGTDEWQDNYAGLALTFDFIFGLDMFLRWLFRGTAGCQHIRDYVDFACFVIPALADIWAFLIWPHISDSDNTKAIVQMLLFIRLVRLVKLLLWVPQLRIMAQTFSHPALYHQIFIVLTTAVLSTMIFAAAGMLWLGGVVRRLFLLTLTKLKKNL